MSTEVLKQPTLKVDADSSELGCIGVTVGDLELDLMASLGRHTQVGGLLPSLLRVSVAQTGAPRGANPPDVLGRYQVLESALRFIPHFPFERGIVYRATFDPRSLGRSELSEVLTIEFSLPNAPDTLPTEVLHFFPSDNCLPENLLRFYVCFSNPMQRGRAESEIALLGSDGEPVPDALYRAPVELWDKSMRCLTVLLDPGRLKRGVGPNRELGPPLKAGEMYTLGIGAGMLDLSGRRLSEAVYKSFRVTEAVREHIAVEQWKILPPVTKSRQPLVLMFPRPLDWAVLAHTITIASAEKQSIDGRIVIDQRERRWSFTPTSPWSAGSYHVCVASRLEDVCGNSVVAAFDRPIRPGNDLRYEAVTRSIDFHLV